MALSSTSTLVERVELRLGIDAARIGLVLAVVLGCAFRVVEFLHHRSFWVDESMVALNIATRSFAELAQPLDLLQSAPLGFLWIERLSAMPFNFQDWSFRLVPLAAGIGLLILMVMLARQHLSRFAAVGLALTVACSFRLIYYSNEVKPYVIDALVIVGLVLLVAPLVSSRPSALTTSARTNRWRILFGLGFIAPWFSTTSAFAVATLMVVITLAWWRSHASVRELRVPVIVVGGALWMVSVLAALRIAAGPEIREAMAENWSGGFLALDASGMIIASEFFSGIAPGFMGSNTLLNWPWYLAIPTYLFIVAGTLSLVKRDWPLALLLVGPLVFSLAASVLGQYPLSIRTWIFVMPALVFLFWAGVDGVASVVGTMWRDMVPIVAALVVVLPVFRNTFFQAHSPFLGEDPRPALEQIVPNIEPTDVVYVHARALPAWLFYTSTFPLSADERRVMQLASPGGPAYLNANSAPALTPADDSALTRRRKGIEIFGTASGFRMTTWQISLGQFDTTWGAREIQRVLAAKPHCVMLFLSHTQKVEHEALTQALTAAGARLRLTVPGDGERYCFPARML